MFDLWISNPYVILLVMMASLFLVLTGTAAVGLFEQERRRFPQAAEWYDLGSKLDSRRVEVSEAEAKLAAINRQIAERDRIGAEVAEMQARRDAVRAELDGLADAIHQIDATKRQAVEAATELALRQDALERAGKALQAGLAARENLQGELEELDRAIAARKAELGRAPEELRDLIGELKRDVETLQRELDEKRVERGMLIAERTELTELATRKASIAAQIKDLEYHLGQMAADAETKAASLSEIARQRDDLQTEIDARRAELNSVRQDLGHAEQRRRVIEDELPAVVSRLEVQKAEVQTLEVAARGKREEVAALEKERVATVSRLDTIRLNAEVLELDLKKKEADLNDVQSKVQELTSRRDALEIRVDELAEQAGAGGRPGFTEDVIEDLKRPPEVLDSLRHSPKMYYNLKSEQEALYQVSKHLKDLHLAYPERVVRAFHTALKINDFSQLTVLAGVSGTGKSLLPRRYSEAMGIRFLPIAVEPRWDSPQDLLGFYNYIEKRFRATDLAQALVHLDPYNTSTLASDPVGFKDDMMIILLDEMNLARVEYYFSEFLSRLEARPIWTATTGEDERRDAMIPVDIRGRQDGPIRLYPSHNMLFVGTMNDDESTQSLSDKVLDRGNIMQFAAPLDFADVGKASEAHAPDHRLRFKTWRSWIRSPAGLSEANRSGVKEAIKKLAEIMNACGRPFGHRLNAAIMAYVANYPGDDGREPDIRVPLADQVELRIMPKLRGLGLDEHGDTFAMLDRFIRQDLDDGDLADRLSALAEHQGKAGGLFNWRGLTR